MGIAVVIVRRFHKVPPAPRSNAAHHGVSPIFARRAQDELADSSATLPAKVSRSR
jgi:hypothetical protein